MFSITLDKILKKGFPKKNKSVILKFSLEKNVQEAFLLKLNMLALNKTHLTHF